MRQIRPRYSVVIPCHNEALYIADTLNSLGKQSFSGEVEIIIVDNNCSDNTVAIAREFDVVIVKEECPGVCSARQAGTAAARGEIVISTDADTTFEKDWLAKIDENFRRQNCVAVAGPCAYSDGPWWGKVYPKVLFGSVALAYHLWGRPFYITATNIAFYKDSWEGYDTVMTQGGDELALLNALSKKGRVVFDRRNHVNTSGRRLSKGVLYSLFVTFLFRYMMAYHLNKLFRKTIIGTAPALRTIKPNRRWRTAFYQFFAVVFFVSFSLVVHLPRHDTLYEQAHETFGVLEKSLRKLVVD